PDEVEQLGALLDAAGGAGEPLMQGQELVGAHPRRKAEKLRQVPERAPRRCRSRRRAADLDAAAGRPDEPARDFDEGRLPRGVRSEQTDELPLAHLDIDAGERLNPAVALLETRRGEDGRHAPHLTPWVVLI